MPVGFYAFHCQFPPASGTIQSHCGGLSQGENLAAIVDSVRRGELDRLELPQLPLDILAQQIVAAAAAEEWTEDALLQMIRRAYPYRNLTREQFDSVIRMLAEGFSTKRGKRSAYLHHDAVNQRIRGRRHARISAIT